MIGKPGGFQWRRLALHRPGPDAVTFLCLLLAAVWLGILAAGGPKHVEAWYDALGLSRSGVLAGRWWQPLSHALMHGSGFHLVTNLALIYGLGGRVQQILGGTAFLRIALAGTLAGAAVHLALPPLWIPEPSLVGASGAAMALLIAFATLSPASRLWPVPLRAGNLGLGVMAATALLGGLQLAFSLGALEVMRDAGFRVGFGDIFRIGHGYHFGGGVAGYLAARWVLRRPVTLDELKKRRRLRESQARPEP